MQGGARSEASTPPDCCSVLCPFSPECLQKPGHRCGVCSASTGYMPEATGGVGSGVQNLALTPGAWSSGMKPSPREAQPWTSTSAAALCGSPAPELEEEEVSTSRPGD